jgi:hypothetical protein
MGYSISVDPNYVDLSRRARARQREHNMIVER